MIETQTAIPDSAADCGDCNDSALIESAARRSQSDRALFDALSDTWLANPEIRAAHAEMLTVIEQLVVRAQDTGGLRPDISAIDIVMLVKGVCESARHFQHLGDEIMGRQLDLVCAAISVDPARRPLRGRPPTPADFEAAMSCTAAAATAADG